MYVLISPSVSFSDDLCFGVKYVKVKDVYFPVLIFSTTMIVYILLQEWIMENWEKNYFITAVSGSTKGSSLVVMSKGSVVHNKRVCRIKEEYGLTTYINI